MPRRRARRPNRIAGALWSTAALAAALAGCAGSGPQAARAPRADTAEPADAPTAEELANATWTGIEETPVTLVDGAWEGEPIVPGGASRPRVSWVRAVRATGDLDGDGRGEAVVLLASSAGGSGEFSYLGVATRAADGSVQEAGTAFLGDRVQWRNVRIDGGVIEIDVVQAGEDDAACCPGEKATRRFRWTPDGLVEESMTVTGRLSLADLEGVDWVLERFARDEPAPREPEVDLRVEGDRIAGSSGCNRYTAGVAAGPTPGEIAVGPIAATRRACPEPETAVETRFLDRLGRVVKFGFVAGRLALTWRDEDAVGVLLFEAR